MFHKLLLVALKALALLSCIRTSAGFVVRPPGSIVSAQQRPISRLHADHVPQDGVVAVVDDDGLPVVVPSSTTSNADAAAPTTSATVAPSVSSSPSFSSATNRQAMYGIDLDMPSSYVRCGKCQAIYAMTEEDLGGRGRRLECCVCDHSWFQSKDRLLTVTSEFELTPMHQRDLDRIKNNMVEGKAAKFMGDKKLYVGNISFQCTEEDLYEIFGKCGEVGEVTMVKDEEGRNRGFGFVTMRTVDGGDKAIAELDGMSIRGRNLAVRSSNN